MDWQLLGIVIFLFIAGLVEDFIEAWCTKMVTTGKVWLTFTSNTIYVIIIYVVFRTIFENLERFWIIVVYAIGSGVGSALLVHLYNRRQHKLIDEKLAKKTKKLERARKQKAQPPEVAGVKTADASTEPAPDDDDIFAVDRAFDDAKLQVAYDTIARAVREDRMTPELEKTKKWVLNQLAKKPKVDNVSAS